MNLHLMFAYVFVIGILIATPGPLMALAMRNAVRYGFISVIPTYLGAVLANLIWALAAWSGLSAFFASFPNFKSPIQIAGAIYLMYLGYQILSSALRRVGDHTIPDSLKVSGSRFVEGFLMDILNPKMIVFYTSFYAQFVVGDGNVVRKFIALFVIQCVIGFSIMSAYSYIAIRVAGSKDNSFGGRIVAVFSGGAMIVFSIATVVNATLS